MKPENASQSLLAVTRYKAKLFEFGIPEAQHTPLIHDPKKLFYLTIGILGDAAARAAFDFSGRALVEDAAGSTAVDGGEWKSSDQTVRETDHNAIRFAARYFDAFLNARFDSEITTEFSLLCASSYELAGSPGSARVISRRVAAIPLELGRGLARFVWHLIADIIDFEPFPSPYSLLISKIITALRFFYDGSADDIPVALACYELRSELYKWGSPESLLYGDIAIAIVAGRIRDSARAILPPSSGLDLEVWADALKKATFPRHLWPAQQRLCEVGLLKGYSAVVQMPTSAGKTKAMELVIRSSFFSKRTQLAVIVAPFRALCHDIRNDIGLSFSGEEVQIDQLSESFRFDINLDEISSIETIIILTPEKLLYLLRRSPEFADRIGLIIYDEGHQFDGLRRGLSYELLLSTLKMILAPSTQIIFISAVVSNANDIALWLLGERALTVSGIGLSPTLRNIAFASWKGVQGDLRYVTPESPDHNEFFIPALLSRTSLAKFRRERKERFFPENGSSDIALSLGLRLCSEGSVAIFCGRKDSVSGLCERLLEVQSRGYDISSPYSLSDQFEMKKIGYLCEEHLGLSADIAKAAYVGVLQHHGSVPHGIRLCIEFALKRAHSRMVICTSTLAQGVNLPIKYLIVTTTQQGKESILSRDFHNLMGRAGRAGMHTEGGVIFAAAEIFDSKGHPSESWRWRNTKRLLDPNSAEPCGSAILSIIKNYEQSKPSAVLEIPETILGRLVFATMSDISEISRQLCAFQPEIRVSDLEQFLIDRSRAIHEVAHYLSAHGNFDSVESSDRTIALVENTLAYHLASEDQKLRLRSLFITISDVIIGHEEFEERKMLLRSSSLPPSTVYELYEWAKSNITLLQGKVDEDTVWSAISSMSISLVNSKSVNAIGRTDIIDASVTLWMNGHTISSIYEFMQASEVRVGKRKLKMEDVVSLCENGFSYDLALIVGTLADLIKSRDPDVSELLAEIHSKLRCGIPDRCSRVFYNAGFADRVVCQALAAKFPGVLSIRDLKYLLPGRQNDAQAVLKPFPAYFSHVLDGLLA